MSKEEALAAAWSREAVELLGSPSSDLADLDHAIRLLRRAVMTTPSGHHERPRYLGNLGGGLLIRFKRTGDRADLDEAVAVTRDAVDASPVGHAFRASNLSNLAGALLTRFRQTGDRADLDAAVQVARSAVDASPPGHADRLGALTNLALALQDRFDRPADLNEQGRPADLDELIAVSREILEEPSSDADRCGHLLRLAKALDRRYQRTHDRRDLDEVIALTGTAVEDAERDGPVLAAALAQLGSALSLRFRRGGDPADIDRAIEIGRQSVGIASVDGPTRATSHGDLAASLYTRYQRSGDLEDLDEAVAVSREAVRLGVGDDGQEARLSNLSSMLRTRYERVGNLADLDEAIGVSRAAAEAAPPGHPNRGTNMSNLGLALRARYERVGDLADLDAAIAASHAAVAAAPPGHPDRAGYLSNLGIALRLRYERVGDLAGLDAAIAAGRAAVAAAPPGHPDRAVCLFNLSTALLARFHQSGQADDLDAAIDVSRQAVTSTPPDHPFRASMLAGLGRVLLERLGQCDDDADLAEAIAGCEAGLRLESAPPLARVSCGKLLGWLLAGRDWPTAVRVWTYVLGLLPQVVSTSLTRDDRQYLLREFVGIGASAAAAALALEDAPGAWELLEQGRGVLLSQALDSRAVGQPGPSSARPAKPSSVGSAGVVSDFSTTIDVLRRHLGPDDLVVAVNISDWRCDALMLGRTGASYLNLPTVTATTVIEKVNSFLDAVRKPGRPANRTMLDILAWLWEAVIGPILEHLNAKPGGPSRRIWWSPTGPLTALPLHAAGLPAAEGQSVLDRVISSYTPNLRLLASRSRDDPGVTAGRSLVVGIDRAPGHPPLVSAVREARAVHAHLGSHEPPLLDAQARIVKVRSELRRCAWVHFACHGVHAPDPADSHLQLWDGPLAVREISNLVLPGAELAYLSACTSAFGGSRLYDEAIHIASAFQVAGFRHVVATLWEISDTQAPRIARDFYRHLSQGATPAEAVHHAVRVMRERFPGQPYLWAPYVHFGP